MAKKNEPQKPRAMTRRAISSHQKAQRRQRFILFGGIGIVSVVVIIVLLGLILGEVVPMGKTVLEINDREYDLGYYTDALEYNTLIQIAFSPDGNVDVNQVNAQVPQLIQEHQAIIEGAASFNITIEDKEVRDRIKEMGLDINDATEDFARAQLLVPKLKEYFGESVPSSGPQVDLEAILVESEAVAEEIRPDLAATDNITDIAREYGLNYYSQNEYFGAFGWHPESIHQSLLNSEIPLEWAFDEATQAGDVSSPLSDNESWKKRGYWVLKVNERNEETNSDNETVVSANVSGLFLGSEAEAEDVRQKLLDGEDLAGLAEEYSQYSPSKEKGGELGKLEQPSDNTTFAISEPVDAYIFDEATETGAWSEPIMDEDFWTQGGYWLVRAVGVDAEREYAEEDRDQLISEKYNEWLTALKGMPEYQVVKTLDSEQQAEAIARVQKALATLG